MLKTGKKNSRFDRKKNYERNKKHNPPFKLNGRSLTQLNYPRSELLGTVLTPFVKPLQNYGMNCQNIFEMKRNQRKQNEID